MLIFQVNPGRVSIHAPVKGRLLRWAGWSGGGDVSIHAPVKGRHRAGRTASGKNSFNPRPREGATCTSCAAAEVELFQSTPP